MAQHVGRLLLRRGGRAAAAVERLLLLLLLLRLRPHLREHGWLGSLKEGLGQRAGKVAQLQDKCSGA